MARETLAPWAERVPDHGPMTADELLRLPDDGCCWELVAGVPVRIPLMTFEQGAIAADMNCEIGGFVEAHGLGAVVAGGTGFILSRPGESDTVLAPDGAFVRADRVPTRGSPEWHAYPRLAPDLVAEVASPDQYRPEMTAKAQVYLDAGVRLVWIVWPAARTVGVWRPGSDAPAATLSVGDTLDGLDVLPGFSYPLAELFA